MRILYICNEYPPYLHGGIGSFTRDIAEAMLEKGHDVYVWGIYSQLNLKVEETIKGVKVVREAGRTDAGRIKSLLFRIQFKQKLQQFLGKNQFDIIECQEWLGLLPFGLNHKGYIVRLHGAAIFFDKLLKRKGNRLTHWFEKKMLKKAKNLVAVSDFCGKETLKLCSIESKVYKVIYNAVDINKLMTFRKESYTTQKIVFANTVSRKKGVFELVKAFNLIAEKYPYSTLYIVGKLNYAENGVNIKDLLFQEVDKKFLSRLFITGWLASADEVYEHLSDAHLCVYPSHMEGFGIAPVEPMAIGKPVLFMKNGPGPEVIEDGISGLLIDSNSPEDIAHKIEKIFESAELAEELSKNAQKRAMDFFNKKTVFAENNESYYKSVLNDY